MVTTNRSRVPNSFGNTGALAEPRESRRHKARWRCECPQSAHANPSVRRFGACLAHFLGAQAHAKIVCGCKPAGEENTAVRNPRSASSVWPRAARRIASILQMRGEPIALGLRDAFDALLRDQVFGAAR